MALLVPGCRDDGVPRPQLVLLYAPCTVNKEFLSPWNQSLSFTPKLAQFAEKSTVFMRHQTETGQSGISYASLFTGSQADHHQVYRHPATLSDDLYLIAEAYADAGYDTFYWNDHAMASRKLNYAQGVDRQHVFSKGLRGDDGRFIEVLERLAVDPEYKAFILTNFTVTHGPYSKAHVARFMRKYPAEVLGVNRADIRTYADLYRNDYLGLTWNHAETLERLNIGSDLAKFASVIEVLYRANVNYLDSLFGDVIDEIASRDLLDRSLIVFTADHGEVLYRESATFPWTHSMLLDHEVQGIPLIIHSPLIDAKSEYSGVTRSTDVFPTMAGLSGIPLPERPGVRGVDLSETLTEDLPAPELVAYSHTTVLVESVLEQMYQEEHAQNWREARKFFPNDKVDQIWVALRSGDEWFKHRKEANGSWVTEVYDLAADPEAKRNLFDPNDASHAARRAELLEYKSMLVRNYKRRGGEPIDNQLPEQSKEELLRSLGYIE